MLFFSTKKLIFLALFEELDEMSHCEKKAENQPIELTKPEETKEPVTQEVGEVYYVIKSWRYQSHIVCDIIINFAALYNEEESRELENKTGDVEVSQDRIAKILPLCETPQAQACKCWYIDWINSPIKKTLWGFWDPLIDVLEAKYPEKDINMVLLKPITDFRGVELAELDRITLYYSYRDVTYDQLTDPNPDNLSECVNLHVIGDSVYLNKINAILARQKSKPNKIIYYPADNSVKRKTRNFTGMKFF